MALIAGIGNPEFVCNRGRWIADATAADPVQKRIRLPGHVTIVTKTAGRLRRMTCVSLKLLIGLVVIMALRACQVLLYDRELQGVAKTQLIVGVAVMHAVTRQTGQLSGFAAW